MPPKAQEAEKPETTAPLTVGQAITEVIRRLPSIGKGQTAPGAMGGFKYRGIEDMTRVIQPILADVGLVIVPRASIVEIRPAPGSKESWQDVVLQVSWSIFGPDGSQAFAQTCGIGRDNADKGANKAQSQAFKYLLMHLFCISDADDDGDGHDYSGTERGEAREPDEAELTMDRMMALVKQIPESGQLFKDVAVSLGHEKLTLAAMRADANLLRMIQQQADDVEANVQADTAQAD